MQQVETSAGIWTQATTSPLRQGPAQVSRRVLQQRYQRRLKLQRRVRFLAFWLPFSFAVLLIGGMVAISLAEERDIPVRSTLKYPLERTLEWAGFGLQQISVSGLRYTPDCDVFDALELKRVRTLLSFDGAAAKARIEALPWVESASISRVLPDGLDVQVIERKPAAVLQAGGKSVVIDRTGRKMASVAADAMPGLLRVAGTGAGQAAPELLGALAQYPSLSGRVQRAERQDGRWILHLTGGAVLQLPGEDQNEALARAAVLVAAGFVGKDEIDLRVAGRDFLGQRKKTPEKPPRAANVTPAAGRS